MTAASSPSPLMTRELPGTSIASSCSISSSSRTAARSWLSVPVDDPRAVEVVRGEFHPHAAPGEDPDPEATHLAGHVAEHGPIHVVELHSEHRIRKGLDDPPLQL